jgi:ketosteroid isomerase-like protein
MYAWAIGRLVRQRFAAMSRGDTAWVLRSFADDATFHYNGSHALAGEYHPKAAIVEWFARAWSLFRMEFEVHDVVVSGPPWNIRVATRFTIRVETEDGAVFLNRAMQYARIRWGKVREDRIYPDTQLVAEAIQHATG